MPGVTFDIAGGAFDVRRADPSLDAKAVRMLLPEMPDDAIAFVATDHAHGLVIGAAASTRAMRRTGNPGPGVAVHVIPPCRRQRVGSALVIELVTDAARRGARVLYAAKRVEMPSDDLLGWQWLGFQPLETVEEHELEIASVETTLGPLVDRLRRDGRIPAAAQVVPLYAVDADAVVRLHLKNLGGDAESLRRRVLGQAPDSFNPRYSLVLTLGGGPVGCLLGHRASRRAFVIDAVVVEPALRNGWANLLLKYEAATRVKPLGATHIRFTSFDHYTDTRSFTRKLGGVTTKRLALMHRPIDA